MRPSRPITTAGATIRSTCATPSAATSAICRSRPAPATFRGSACRCSIRATTSPLARRRRSRPGCSTICASASTRCGARTCRRTPASTAMPRSASRDRALNPVDLGYMVFVVPGFETLGDDPNLPVVRRTRTIHVSDSLTIERGRHHAKLGGEFRSLSRRTASTISSRAGQTVYQGVYTGIPGRRPAARLPDVLAAGGQRQPAGAAHVGGQRLSAGRLAHHADADDQRRRALRAGGAALRCRRSHADLEPRDLRAGAGRGGRRVAIGARHATSTTSRRASASAGISAGAARWSCAAATACSTTAAR